MSAIYRRKDGRWSCCISIGGKQKHIYGKSAEEVAEKRDKLAGTAPASATTSHQLVSEFLSAWLETVVKVRNKPSTHKSYSDMIRLHINPAIGHLQLRSLPPQQVQQMLNRMYANGLKPRTVQYAKAILHRALEQAMKWEYVTRNVAALVDAPRVEKYPAVALTEAQIAAFFTAIRGHRLEPLYWLALLGLRRGELLGLRWADVDMAKATVRVTAGKTSSSARTLPLSPTLVEILSQHWERQQAERQALGVDWKEHGFLFPSEVGTGISGRNLVRHFKSVVKKANLPQHIRFHDLRHTAATLLLEQGQHPKTVQAILGHSQIGITMDVYSHVALHEQEKAVQSLEGLFRKLSG
jgi:integrase